MNQTIHDFDYPLEQDRIAQTPLEERDQSRLMRLNRTGGRIEHHRFCELPDLLCEGDLLVLNDTQVVPAKFACRRHTGGKVDGLFLRETEMARWKVLLRNAGRCKPGERLTLLGCDGVELELLADCGQGKWQVAVTPPAGAMEVLQQAGATPLPPYIRRTDRTQDPQDRKRYQTVYAARPGAVAAPTAGLHFTEELFARLAEKNIETARVTLHVALGTFAPIKSEDFTQHKMHSEWYELPEATAATLQAAKAQGRRIVAVGTTSVRVLESAVRANPGRQLRAVSGWTELFLYPPAEFHAVDAMITNFHLPKSTLLMLVSAFCSPGKLGGREMILDAYAEARRMEYRFFSYGDAMLIE